MLVPSMHLMSPTVSHWFRGTVSQVAQELAATPSVWIRMRGEDESFGTQG